MIATKTKEHDYYESAELAATTSLPSQKLPNEPSAFPSKRVVTIYLGLCHDCEFLGKCDWQHNNKISCEHYK